MSNGAVFTDRLDEKEGKPRTDLVKIPEKIDPAKIWEKVVEELILPSLTDEENTFNGLKAEHLNKIFEHVSKVARDEGRDITKEDIAHFLKANKVPDPNDTAKKIFDTFNRKFQPAMYQKFGGEQFPSDEVIRTAMQHVKSRRQVDPTQPKIVIPADFGLSKAYAEAVMLYCVAHRIEFVDESPYKGQYEKVDINSSRTKNFQKMLDNKSSELGYERGECKHRDNVAKIPELETRYQGPSGPGKSSL
jgi:hypothetical protein